VILVKAGVNDVINDGYCEQESVADFMAIASMIRNSPSQCLVTLPTKLRDPVKAQRVTSLNARLQAELLGAGCELVDLNSALAPDGVLLERYTTDGVHLNAGAYRLWAEQLKHVLP